MDRKRKTTRRPRVRVDGLNIGDRIMWAGRIVRLTRVEIFDATVRLWNDLGENGELPSSKRVERLADPTAVAA